MEIGITKRVTIFLGIPDKSIEKSYLEASKICLLNVKYRDAILLIDEL